MPGPVPVPVPLNRQTACDDRLKAGPSRESRPAPGFPEGMGGARPPGTWPNGPPSIRIHPRPFLQPIAQRQTVINEATNNLRSERRGNILPESAKL